MAISSPVTEWSGIRMATLRDYIPTIQLLFFWFSKGQAQALAIAIQKPNHSKLGSLSEFIFLNSAHLSGFQMVKQQDFISHSKSIPFTTQLF